MAREVQVVKLERLSVRGPGLDIWFLRPGSRGRPWVWFQPHEVPFVDALDAYFEIERIRGGWRVLGQVGEPDHRRKVVVPDVDFSRPWPRFPRTLGEVRSGGRGSFRCHCKCGNERIWFPAGICRAFDGWTLEELQRAGFWRCACGKLPSVGVYADHHGDVIYVERWPVEAEAWIRL
ncbi:MAG: hypothetical protein KKE02_05870 [Alphaproteobacteria bacterium]|nr:hypothetical protein [Alphaproteobacteria bacterium]MBU1512915.1 hypothetical protein [Alphaproteobacteria bacterium]MBU2096644.1 hypothetical protein [Alphaproteobacteria bacterium]MBU2150527.1 hypothetical protein [Alphaproteobacteria bacterium]MBU2306544.1 hypothetical protein [Alphaproteobacteria bacterium]